MKKYLVFSAAAAALLVSATAGAVPSGKDQSVKADKENSGGGGASSGGGGASASETTTDFRSDSNPDKALEGPGKTKPWEIDGGFEAHKLLRTNDLNGAGADKYFQYYFATLKYDFDRNDRVQLDLGLYERFLSDPQETGFRADDIALSYTRFIPLPAQFEASVKGTVIAPTSFVSYRESLITAPSLQLRLDKRLGQWVNVDARSRGSYYVYRYNTEINGGTDPNARAGLSFALEGEVTMPFFHPLSAGLGLYTRYGWYLPASSTIPDGATQGSGQVGVTPDNQFTQQPIQQTYGGEMYVRYRLPTVVSGLGVDAEIAYAQGDPSLGFTSALHDGVSHYYLFYRQTSEVYGALTARY